MFQSNSSGMRGAPPKPLHALFSIIALVGTVFVAPLIWPLVEHPILMRLDSLYGWDAAILIGGAIMIGTYPLTFYAIRVGISAAYTALMVFVGTRFL